MPLRLPVLVTSIDAVATWLAPGAAWSWSGP